MKYLIYKAFYYVINLLLNPFIKYYKIGLFWSYSLDSNGIIKYNLRLVKSYDIGTTYILHYIYIHNIFKNQFHKFKFLSLTLLYNYKKVITYNNGVTIKGFFSTGFKNSRGFGFKASVLKFIIL